MKKYHSTNINDCSFLVTGGAGFIGSNLVDYLMFHGAGKVRVLDNLSTGSLNNLDKYISSPRFEFIEGDICDLDICKEAVKDIDYISHQAALGSVPRSIVDPCTTNSVNISGFLNILIAAKDSNKLKMFVYAASSSTYGDIQTSRKKEDTIGEPLSPYAVTKLVNELYASVFHRVYGLNSIGLRYFNIFGPKQNIQGPYAAVIPQFITKILNGESPLINGDGLHSRDFTHVQNAIQANLKALFTKNPEAMNQIYNIACGDTTSLNDMFRSLKSISGTTIEAQYGPERVGDIKVSLADIRKAEFFLDYHPQILMEQGLTETFNWFKSNYHA